VKRVFLFAVLAIFISGNSDLLSGYVDLGNDPDKIYIKNIYEIPKSDTYKFKGFSRNGEFLAFSVKKTIKSMILKSDGSVYKKIEDYFITWTNNIDEIIAYEWLGDNSDKNVKIEILNLRTGHKRYLDLYTNLMKANKIIYNTYNNKLIFGIDGTNDLYEYDFVTDKSSKLISLDFKIDNYVIASKDTIIVSKINQQQTFRWEILNLNLKSKKIKKLFPNPIRLFEHYNLRLNKVIISFEYEGSICFIDSNGNTISNKIKLFPFKYPEDKNRIFSYDMSPNGKLLCVTNGFLKYEMDDGFTIADLFIFNLNGKWKRLTNSENKLEFIMAWSPQGDKLIYFDNKTKKYSIVKLGKTN